MGWTSPRTYVAGEIITAAILNTHLRDQLLYLKGTNQVPTISSGLVIDNTDGDEYLKLPAHTTAESTSVLSASANLAKVVYNQTSSRISYRDSATIQTLLNVSDVDDIPVDGASTDPVSSNWAYDFGHVLTSAGDIPYSTATAGDWARLGKGTVAQVLRMSTASLPEWATLAGYNTKLVNYTGISASGAISYASYGFQPKTITILGNYGTDFSQGIATSSIVQSCLSWNTALLTALSTISSVFEVGGRSGKLQSLDADGFTIYWTLSAAVDLTSWSALAQG